jgi:asparaginyl-tRNA synthetase
MFNKRTKIIDILSMAPEGQTITAMGWIKAFRNNQFISLSDGSTAKMLQVYVPLDSIDTETLKRFTTSASIKVSGTLLHSVGKGQLLELKAEKIEVLGDSPAHEYPLQPKKHSLEFLREIAHLRMRTSTFGSVFRIRHSLAYAIHSFFHNRGFLYWHSPIITSSDAEGAGEMFRVTTLPVENIPRKPNGEPDFGEDFFGKPTHLTVSGQLEGELAAMAFSEVYTFGPTFRAENSNTSRHLAEFWMIEPEMAFYDLEDNMNLAESFIQYVILHILENHSDDLDFLNTRLIQEESQIPVEKRSPMGLIDKLRFIVDHPFERIPYSHAIDILRSSSHYKKKKFQYEVSWGIDMQSEHERYLVEKHFQKPVIVTDYPKDIKAFYMRQNDDGRTVAAMDILAPGIGEIVGGSQREERYDLLVQRMMEMSIPTHEMEWYLDTRRFGTVPHAGFGLGFERLVQFVTGMSNIRDVIPFPRTPKNAQF